MNLDRFAIVFSGVTKSVTDILTAAARVLVSVQQEVRRRPVTQILHDDLHWLDVADRVTYTSLVSSCTDVGMARLHSTLSTVAHRSTMLLAGSVSGRPPHSK